MNHSHLSPCSHPQVVAQLVGLYVASGLDLCAAVTKATTRLDGTWGLAVVDRMHPDVIVAARNGSPMLIGIGQVRRCVWARKMAEIERWN